MTVTPGQSVQRRAEEDFFIAPIDYSMVHSYNCYVWRNSAVQPPPNIFMDVRSAGKLESHICNFKDICFSCSSFRVFLVILLKIFQRQLDHEEQTPVYFGEWESSWRTPGPMGETFDAGHPDHIDHFGSISDSYWFTGPA